MKLFETVKSLKGLKGNEISYKHHTLTFPIPIEDTGSGTFEPIMKAITLMRWIRKALKNDVNFVEGK